MRFGFEVGCLFAGAGGTRMESGGEYRGSAADPMKND